jgi:hypothetical protein
MAVNKRYVANNRQSLMLIINSGLSQQTIEFKPGYGLRNEGYFLTNDLAMQQALEKDHRYNKSYRLDAINNIPIAEWIARNTIAQKEKEKEDKLVKEVNPVPGETEQKKDDVPRVPEKVPFSTSQEAKDWLNKEHGVPFNQITNKKKIIDKAIELGLKIEFVNENN